MRKMSGVPLGVAADAIDTARRLLSGKVDRMSGVLYRDIPRVQSAIAKAHSMLGSARSYVFSSREAQWRSIEAGDSLTDLERANVWLSRSNAFQRGRDVVALLYDTIGGSAIHSRKNPFDRHVRDMQTACHYVVAQTKGWEGVGAMLLGGDESHPFL